MPYGKKNISDKWIRASVVGTIWAAAEIVLGSFLHNLRVPFSGNLLTAIGLILLISVNYKWRVRGLYWRAGLICALLKTLSPSAVIFGPMIAIISESLLLEFSVRIFGRTMIGFMVGSMLAMSWNLFQKIFNLIIFYGSNLVEIYSSITSYAAKQLNLKFDTFWSPLLLLLLLYSLFGAVTSVFALRIGRKMTEVMPAEMKTGQSPGKSPGRRDASPFHYSFLWLTGDIMVIIGLLIIVSSAAWPWWVASVIPAVIILSLRYKRALRQLSKPRFWVFFVLITMLSAVAFTLLQHDKTTLSEGILIGVQMNFRAIIIIIGFSALGTELYNPVIRNYFYGSRFSQLPVALELSASSLPAMIEVMPDFRTTIKNPAIIIRGMVDKIERLLAEMEKKSSGQQVLIVTGNTGVGKTTFLEALSAELKAGGMLVSGILAPRIIEDGVTVGYDILDVGTGLRVPFLRHLDRSVTTGVERFVADEEGEKAGREALDISRGHRPDIIIIDEAGPIELKGGGWHDSIMKLTGDDKPGLVIAVRRSLVQRIINHFGLKEVRIIEAETADAVKTANNIKSEWKR